MRTSEVGLGPSETRVPRTGRTGQRGPQQREAAAAQGTRPPGGPQAQALMRTRGPPHPSQDSDLMCLSVISRPPRDTTLTFYVSRGSEPTLPPGMAPAWADVMLNQKKKNEISVSIPLTFVALQCLEWKGQRTSLWALRAPEPFPALTSNDSSLLSGFKSCV